MIEINKKLKKSYIIDLTKPEIDKFERANIIIDYIGDNNISMIEFCNEFGFKKGTVSGWLKWSALGEKEYNNMKNKGLSESDITNMLKNPNYTIEGDFINRINTLTEFIKKNNRQLQNLNLSQQITMLRNLLNHLIYKNGD